jgi:trans-2,3-dihydro-3-hydroxyanthranilate isomerase
VWWDLDGSAPAVDALREDLRGNVGVWSEVPGLRLKFWVADRERNRWGAVMLWEAARPPAGELPLNRAAELIGCPPTHRLQFEVEALVEGTHPRNAPGHEYIVVDAFTREPLAGNPVAVFLDGRGLTDERMQRIAAEMHLSEVTFVLPAEQGGDARIRIFTPVNELPFAGHPILGTAVALGYTRQLDRLRLETAMGLIQVELSDDGGSVWVRMDQPIPTWRPYERTPDLLAALGITTSVIPVEIYRNGPRHVFVGLASVPALSAVNPDHRALARFPDMAVNCFAGAGTQWRTRMFSPAYGVVEDAATGSAAGPLAVHLARHGVAKYGQNLEILQGVEMGRPSLMRATAEGSGEHVTAVRVGGHGVVAAHGTIYA